LPILHAIVLGIVQGLTEFFPISSSGHLLLVPWLFGWHDFTGPTGDSLQKTFDVALHLGTLAGAIAYFRADLVRYIRAGTLVLFRRSGGQGTRTHHDGRIAWLLVLASIPAAITGALFSDVIERNLDDKIWLIAVMLIVFGVLLGWADRRPGRREVDSFGVRDAVAMGVGQALALQPGVSRSGATMTLGRVTGLDRAAAARISFLMMIVITAGAVVFKAKDVGSIPSDFYAPFVWGIITSAVTGWLAVWATLRLVSTKTFDTFVVYRVLAGLAVLALLASSFR
jgi:undecaprenyl-diphosphatase